MTREKMISEAERSNKGKGTEQHDARHIIDGVSKGTKVKLITICALAGLALGVAGCKGMSTHPVGDRTSERGHAGSGIPMSPPALAASHDHNYPESCSPHHDHYGHSGACGCRR
ncbi:hypothetical protein CSB45_07485 [candidate division KSB3 bacterium]|uniref:Uncharacterized protein n=1 Tax=candidate division KSB3 bacterium TaxID=2044937 RepID=A0A2G6E6E8_9BACT|nr:MAG: hypothetical protein CSB45_07485 [candidate division KSB3 bacterium]PIE29877.1 MAG: hypothetical protein CSA57_06190 [candidate division KSB3 bacterium]